MSTKFNEKGMKNYINRSSRACGRTGLSPQMLAGDFLAANQKKWPGELVRLLAHRLASCLFPRILFYKPLSVELLGTIMQRGTDLNQTIHTDRKKAPSFQPAPDQASPLE